MYVILKGGDFEHPYHDLSGDVVVYEDRQTAEQVRRAGDVVVAAEDWIGWDK